jgi:hypothetical protein
MLKELGTGLHHTVFLQVFEKQAKRLVSKRI